MNLESFILQVRPRTPWEAMDLAVRLSVSHWKTLASAWLVTVLPLIVVIAFILIEEHPYWTFFLVWFLKPLYDRVPLFVLSRIIFAEKITWQDVVQAVPSFFKTGIFSTLTLYRLDPSRSFGLPVRQLEGLKGQVRKNRMRILNRNANNREILLMILCFHLESLVFWGLLGLLLLMLPQHLALESAETFLLDSDPGLVINLISLILYFFVMMIIETLYVAGGFLLYLNRRIILEGWDIELIFKKMSQRVSEKTTTETAKPSISSTPLSLFLFGLVFALFTISPTAEAATYVKNYDEVKPEVNHTPLAPEQSGEVIKEVMQHPLFNRFKTIKEFKYTGPNEEQEKRKEGDLFWLSDFFEFIGRIVALLFEFGLWLLLFFVIYLLVKYRDRFVFKRKAQSLDIDEIPDTLFGLDIREESLPDDIAAQAMQLYRDGEYRAALALLYRGTLAYLVKHYPIRLEKGATEGDCVYLVTHELTMMSEDKVNFFVNLTKAWQLTAYAHRQVPEEEMSKFCQDWSHLYGNDQANGDNSGSPGEHQSEDNHKDGK